MKNKLQNITTIYFVRHGDVVNPGKIIYGNLPLPLSYKGEKQARKLGQFFSAKKINLIYSSPIPRCRQTASIIAWHLKPLKVKTSLSLIELEWAVFWQGIPLDKMYQKFGSVWHTYLTKPGELNYKGLTLHHTAWRMKKFLVDLLKKHSGENIICVSHGDPIKALILLLQKRSMNDLRKIKLYYGGAIQLKFNGKRLIKYKLLKKGKGSLV